MRLNDKDLSSPIDRLMVRLAIVRAAARSRDAQDLRLGTQVEELEQEVRLLAANRPDLAPAIERGVEAHNAASPHHLRIRD